MDATGPFAEQAQRVDNKTINKIEQHIVFAVILDLVRGRPGWKNRPGRDRDRDGPIPAGTKTGMKIKSRPGLGPG